MGGSGSSGGVSFPDYIEQFHDSMIGSSGPSTISGFVDLDEAMAAAFQSDPYSGQATPSKLKLENALSNWSSDAQTPISNLDSVADWKSQLGEVVTEIITNDLLEDIDASSAISNGETDATSEVDAALTEAESAVQSSVVDPVIDEFEQKVNSRLAERKRSVSSLYADVNAVHSSGFLISQALLERDAQREINQRDSETRLEMYQQAFQAHLESFAQALEVRLRAQTANKQSDDQLVNRGIQQVLQTDRQDHQLLLDERSKYLQGTTADFEANSSQRKFEVDMDQKSALWELQIHERGGNVLAAPSGMAARTPAEKSDASKAIGGALSGAGTGAAVGSVVPGVGTAVGAGVGAVLGGASGFL